jgi:hypothetical protein
MIENGMRTTSRTLQFSRRRSCLCPQKTPEVHVHYVEKDNRGDTRPPTDSSQSHLIAADANAHLTAPTPSSPSPPPLVKTRKTTFSFLGHPEERNALAKAYKPIFGIVPNNDAKTPLPMWSSSLTSPKLELQRQRLDSWIAPHLSAGFHDDALVEAFVRWLCERADAAERADGMMSFDGSEISYLSYALQHHVQLKLRAGGSCRGVFARRAFAPGDVILAVPNSFGYQHRKTNVDNKTKGEAGEDSFSGRSKNHIESPLWGLHLNSDTLRRFSAEAQKRGVPSYATVWEIVSKRRSSLDPHVHPLFADQIYTALFLACEKEAGEASPLYPYLRLLPDPAVDDDGMLEIHHGVLTPASHLEYHDHKNRFHLYVHQLHNAWAEANAAAAASREGGCDADGNGGENDDAHDATTCSIAPPSQDALMWAMRTVLARQLMLPHFRPVDSNMTDVLTKETTLKHILDGENFWMRNVTKIRQWWLQHVFRVLDLERMKQFEFDATTIPTMSPLFDMISHDAKGGNVVWDVERSGSEDSEETPAAEGSSSSPTLVLVATRHIAVGQELTRSFRRCYSTSYTLFRYGFLAVNDREADRCSDLVDAGVDPLSIGWDRPDIAVPRLAEATEEANRRQRLASAASRSGDVQQEAVVAGARRTRLPMV